MILAPHLATKLGLAPERAGRAVWSSLIRIFLPPLVRP